MPSTTTKPTPADPSLDMAKILESYRAYLGTIADEALDPALKAKVGASDLVQETLMAACRHVGSFQGETRKELKGWLRGIMLNLVSDTRKHFRGTQKRRIDREISLGAADTQIADATTSIETRQARRERDEVLEDAVSRLPEHHRRILQWHIRDDWTFARIGQELAITEGAARKQWARALLHLRRLMESKS